MRKNVLTAAVLTAAAVMTVSMASFAGETQKVDANGITVEIPAAYSDLLTVRTEGLGDGELISVSETASIEAAQANGMDSDGAGWLFSISRVPEAEADLMRCGDMSGMEIFAENDGFYYIYNHPTDVRMVRATNEEMTEDMDQWSELNEWAAGEVRQGILAGNPELDAETFSNTTLDMLPARAAYRGDVQYEIRSLELGGEAVDMSAMAGDDLIEELADDATYEVVTDTEAPDGEYIVLAFNADGEEIRYDFFSSTEAANLIRETRVSGDEEMVTLYRASFDDPEDTAYGEIHELLQKYLQGDDDNSGDLDD